MNPQVNVALQVLPNSQNKNTYELVDKAIEHIQKSGIKHKVCPFETVMEGNYDTIMQLVKEIHDILYQNGTDNMLAYLKIHSSANHEVTIADKMKKYDK